MKAFTMEVEYLDAESGEWATENVWIDDAEVIPPDSFQPEPDDNDECPW